MQRTMHGLLAIIAILLAGIVFGLFTQRAQSQSLATSPRVAPYPSSMGRFQLLVPSDNSQYIIDTQTGRFWYRYGTGLKATWEEQSPDYSLPPVMTKP